jgi:DNA-binding CsgD family transcriptional regulator
VAQERRWDLPVVGRDAELQALRGELRRVRAGEFRCVLITGDAGVGKTRLAHELLRPSARGLIELRARAHAFGTTTAFGLWIEALERHLSGLEPQHARRLCEPVADDLAGVLRTAALACDIQGAAPPPRARMLAALAVLVRDLAAERPVAVVFDDVHLADPSSVHALHYLAGDLATTPVLVLATGRSAELAEQRLATEVMLRLEQESVLRRVQVRPLSGDAVRDLAATILDRPAVPDALVAWLADRSRGNPLFAIGLLHALLDEGGDIRAPALRALPESLTERIAGELGGLDGPELATLELLSVLERTVGLTELEGLSPEPPERLAAILEALPARLVHEQEHGREPVYELAHPLIQGTIYARIGGARRRSLHRRLARDLLKAGRLGEAASHFARSAQPGDDEAIAALCDAVRQADEHESHAEEIALLDVLLELVPEGDARWLDVAAAMSLHASWVVEHRADVGGDTAIRALRQIVGTLEQGGDLRHLATAKLRLGCFLTWTDGRLDEGEAMVRDALACFRHARDDGGVLLCEYELAWLLVLTGRRHEQLAAGEALLARAEAAADEFVTLQAVGLVGGIALHGGPLARARAMFERSTELASRQGKRHRTTWSLANLGKTHALEGRLDRARALFGEAATADPSHRETLLLELRCECEWLAGDYAAALDTARDSLGWASGQPSRRKAPGLVYGAMSAAERDLPAEAHDLARRAAATYEGRRFWHFDAMPTWADGAVAGLEGEPERGLPLVVDAAERILAAGTVTTAAQVLADAAELAADCGDHEAARWAGGQLRGLSEALDTPLFRGLEQLGAACAALDADPADAARSAGAARETLLAAGALGHHARALALQAAAVRATDGRAAVVVLTEAAERFDACGAAVRRGRVLRALEDLGVQGRRAADAARGPDSLTDREREIAVLAADGCTARTIGERLFISRRTVETHLAHAYAKLGVASKVDLVRRRGELGL